MSKAVAQDHLSVKVLAPLSRLYEGSAVSVSAINKVGRFDVLAGHTNFFSLLLPSDVVINTGTNEVIIKITGGLLKVRRNEVTLFVNINEATAI